MQRSILLLVEVAINMEPLSFPVFFCCNSDVDFKRNYSHPKELEKTNEKVRISTARRKSVMYNLFKGLLCPIVTPRQP